MSDRVDLAEGVLDHQLIDRDGRRCGKVDDLELEWERGRPPRVTAILSGPGALPARVPAGLRPVLRLLVSSRIDRILWDRVGAVEAAVHLEASAPELGLGTGDDRAAGLVGRLPGA